MLDGLKPQSRALDRKLIDQGSVNWVVAPTHCPVVRNLLITQSYHDLSSALSSYLVGFNCTWPTFGCWASKAAGAVIRGDELALQLTRSMNESKEIEKHLRRLPVHLKIAGSNPGNLSHTNSVQHLLQEELRRLAAEAGDFIAQGNKIVYEEMGTAFVRLLDLLSKMDPNPDDLDELLALYTDGTVEADLVEFDRDSGTVTNSPQGGQGVLKEMLRQYYHAAQATDPTVRAERSLLANAWGSLHEQTRLQNFITGSLDRPFDDFFADVLQKLKQELSSIGSIGRAVEWLGRPLLWWWSHRLEKLIRKLWEDIATATLVTLHLPDGTVLWLGADVPPLSDGHRYPAVLEHLQLSELIELYDRFNALGDHSAAHDWVSLKERMKYVLTYFRSRQLEPTLFGQPFTDQQRTQILKGQVPPGPL